MKIRGRQRRVLGFVKYIGAIGFARACGKTRILVVERGVPVKGFDIDKEYIELDRRNPLGAISILSDYLSCLKLGKEQKQVAAAILLGIIGLLVLISD